MVESQSTALPLAAPTTFLAVRIPRYTSDSGSQRLRKMSNYLAQNRLAFEVDWSVAVVTWGG
jgi:hypothetical protein